MLVLKALLYGVAFTVVDLILFASVYFLFALLLKSFPVADAMTVAGYEVLWRLMYLQALIEVIFIAALWFYGRQSSFVLTFLCGLTAFIGSWTVAYRGNIITALKLFGISLDPPILGEGLVFVFTLVATWLIVRRSFLRDG